MKSIKSLLICMVLIMFACLQTEAKTQKEPLKEVAINFNNLKIDDFVKLVSNILNKNILLQNSIPGNIDFIPTTPVYEKDLSAILQSVLGSKGYSIVDRGAFLEIVRSKEATRYNLPLVKNVDSNYLQMVTKIIPVRGIGVDLIVGKIKHLGSSSTSIVAVKDSNSILITDFPANIKTIEQTIQRLESTDRIQTKLFKLKNTEAVYIYPALKTIAKNGFDGRIATERVTLAIDETGNSIIAMGSQRNLRVLSKIIRKLDMKTKASTKDTAIIALKNTEAKDVLAVLKQILISTRKTNITRMPSVVSEPNTNSIVISGTRADIKRIKSIVEKLDKEQRQVYVKARIIEVSKEATEQLGAKYGLIGGKANSDGLFTMAMNMGGDPIITSVQNLGITQTALQSGLALGASIDFLVTNGAANTVAEPSILCINNKESKIYVGQTQSIITSATTTDNKNDLSRNTYTREDIGLTLKIKPRISNDGKVSIKADTTVEDVVPNSKAGAPTTTKREVTTRAIVKNGESVIVGGLIKDKSSISTSKVPLLGDIPLLGEVFTHHEDSGDNLNLVIILTPYIIDESEDLSELRKKLVELDSLQSKYNKRFMNYLRKQNLRAVEEDLPKEKKVKKEIKNTKNTKKPKIIEDTKVVEKTEEIEDSDNIDFEYFENFKDFEEPKESKIEAKEEIPQKTQLNSTANTSKDPFDALKKKK